MRTGIKQSRQRGRPKQYDEESAIEAAGAVFWVQGYSATSLDDLSTAMGMNRPSIYRAFGDKEALYRLALARFSKRMSDGFDHTIAKEVDFREGLRKFYRAALDVYSAGDAELGCMVMCTAPAASGGHPNVQADLLAVIDHLDGEMLGRAKRAVREHQLSATIDVKTLCKLLQALLHSLALRARAGESKVSLRRFADDSIRLLVGAATKQSV